MNEWFCFITLRFHHLSIAHRKESKSTVVSNVRSCGWNGINVNSGGLHCKSLTIWFTGGLGFYLQSEIFFAGFAGQIISFLYIQCKKIILEIFFFFNCQNWSQIILLIKVMVRKYFFDKNDGQVIFFSKEKSPNCRGLVEL